MVAMVRVTKLRDRTVSLFSRPTHWTAGLNRYAEAHALASAADALVAVSLAGSLFFSISPDASRDQVLLYLVVNMVPFTFLAPLIGPVIDRFHGSRRVIVTSLFVVRAILAAALVFTLFDLALYFFALALLVAGKASGVTRQALVPSLVESPEHLVSANSRLARVSLIAGTIGGATGAAILAATSPQVSLSLACVAFVGAAVAATRLRTPVGIAADELAPEAEYLQMHTPMVVSTSWAFTAIRASVGFFVFGMAFALRRASEPAFLYGLAAAAYAFGTFAGNALAPILRRHASEERLAAGSLVTLGVVASFGALGPSRLIILLVAAVLGMAASMGRQAFDALVQTRTPLTSRGSAFARFETRFQLGWVAGAIAATAISVPVRVSMAVVAVAMVGAALFYLRDISEARLAMASDTFNPVALARRRIESLNTIERIDHPTVAVIELASVADLARATGNPVDVALMGQIEKLRHGVLAGADPDPDELNRVIEQMALVVATYADPSRAGSAPIPTDGPPRRPWLTWPPFRRRPSPGTSP